ncbi:MAG: orotidine 5'-phosphate decarboxylase / HUMPS family protein, partial [Collinsella intestinalis]
MLETDARDRIIVAIDCDRDRAIELADALSGHASWLKVGMTLFYAEGPSIVREFNERGFKVFLDLKFHDIPHQVRGAARSAALAGADLLSVHG